MANDVIDFELTTDPIQAKVALNAAFDGTTQTGLKAESANIAANVTTNINGHAIADILEEDGTTVKEATHAGSAASADELAGTTGGKWVVVVEGSMGISSKTVTTFLLRKGNLHNFYVFSVYNNSVETILYPWDGTSLTFGAYIEKSYSAFKDLLYIYNQTNSSITFYYKVLAWE